MIRIRNCAFALALSVSGTLWAQEDRAALARRLVASGDPARAIPEFVQAVESSPSDAGLWTELGEARLAAGQAKAAVTDLGRAVKLDPSAVRPQKSLAEAVEASGNAQRALVEWRRLAQISEGADRDLAESRTSALLAKLGLPVPVEKGSASAKAASQKGAHSPAAAIHAPDPREAAKTAHAPANLQSALDTWKAGNRDSALSLIREVLKTSPSAEAWFWGGVMRLEEKAWSKADYNFRKAEGDPKLAGRLLYWQGRSAEGQGKIAQAKALWKKSLEKEPEGEFSADIRHRLEEGSSRPMELPPVAHEDSPPLVPDSLRELWSWTPPDISIPPAPSTPPGQLLADAARQLSSHQNDLALSSIERLRMEYPGTPEAESSILATAIVNFAMGLHALAATNAQLFAKEHADHSQAPLARFLAGISLLRQGLADSSLTLLKAVPAKAGPGWTEAERQSALAQAYRLKKMYPEALQALKTAFAAEKNPGLRRSLALRAAREARSAGVPVQARPLVGEARKGCTKGNSCLQLAVTEADLAMEAGESSQALGMYRKVASDWPSSPEAAWAAYQSGSALIKLGKPDDAARTWKDLLESHPGSYWASQARLRIEDAMWRSKYKEVLK
ncbi:MAG: tetratricopeptide repeat protein [Fibrobacteria bacterium]|nr:tetratricopeptide repeat protein [Fibrobacteria bacterium]